jgi:hypothetical protein
MNGHVLHRARLWIRSVRFVAVMSLVTVAAAGFFPSTASAASSQLPTVTTVCASVQQPGAPALTTSSVITRSIASLCVDLENRLGVAIPPPVPPPGTPLFDIIEYALILGLVVLGVFL